jgi:hypothetical protein
MRCLIFLALLTTSCASAPFETVHGVDPFTGSWALQTEWYDTPDGRRALGGAAEIRRGFMEYRAEMTVHEVSARGQIFWARETCRSRLRSRRENPESLTLRCDRTQGSIAYLGAPGYRGHTLVLRKRSRDELVGEVTSGDDVPVIFRRVHIEFMLPAVTAP